MSQPGPLPLLGGATEELIHERASATPCHLPPLPERLAAREAAPQAPLAASLRQLQGWFQAVVTHPADLEAALAGSALLGDPPPLDRVLTHGPRLHAYHRLAVYHAGYRARLVECLLDDYPTLQSALGEEAFEGLCLAYIQAHPSTSRSLNFFGRHMADFCRTTALASEPFASLRGFCADLAALEWALVEVLHAPEAPSLSHHELSQIPPERWGEARLPPSEAARLLRFDHPVNAYFQTLRNGDYPEVPDAAPSATVVYRQGYTIWRMDLTPTMATLLEALFAGVPLGEALGAIEVPEGDAEAAAAMEQSVMRWFGEWVAGGLFAGVEFSPAPG